MQLTAFRNTITRARSMSEVGSKQLAWAPAASTPDYSVDVEPVAVHVKDGWRTALSQDDETLLYPDTNPDNLPGLTVAQAIAEGVARII